MTAENRLDFLEAVHSMSLFNLSMVLDETSQAEFFVMTAVDKINRVRAADKYSIASIADMLHVSSPAISRTITTLEKRGFAERYIDKPNRRNRGVRLTPLGEEVYERECSRMCGFVSNVFEKMGEDKIHMLMELSDELFIIMEEELKLRGSNLMNTAGINNQAVKRA